MKTCETIQACAELGIDAGPYPLRLPLDDKILEELRWYLEQYPRWPVGPDVERAERIKAQLAGWGRELFNAVFASTEAIRVWTQFRAHEPGRPRLLTLDCRGHGATEPLGEEARLNFSAFADDVVALLDHLGIEQAIVGGISMGAGVALNLACIGVALSGVELHQFIAALFLLGVGWNFLFTGSTTLAITAYRPEEKDRAQGAINFFVFATMAGTSLASGALVTTSGWNWLNLASLPPLLLTGGALLWLMARQRGVPQPG